MRLSENPQDSRWLLIGLARHNDLTLHFTQRKFALPPFEFDLEDYTFSQIKRQCSGPEKIELLQRVRDSLEGAIGNWEPKHGFRTLWDLVELIPRVGSRDMLAQQSISMANPEFLAKIPPDTRDNLISNLVRLVTANRYNDYEGYVEDTGEFRFGTESYRAFLHLARQECPFPPATINLAVNTLIHNSAAHKKEILASLPEKIHTPQIKQLILAPG